MSGSNPAPWDAGSVAYLAETVNAITYRVTFTHSQQVYTSGWPRSVVPDAWDVVVTLDAGAVPLGRATFKTPPTPWGTSEFDRTGSTYEIVTVKIEAGYTRLIGGVLTEDLQTLMNGYVTGSRLRTEAGQTFIEWTVDTAETLYEYPSHRTYGGPASTNTRVKQVTDAWSVSADPWYINPVVVEGTLNTPTTTQLTNFRNCELEIGDNAGDYLRQLAVCLGQKLRADHRAAVLRLQVTAEPTWDTAANYLDLVATTYEDLESADQWGNVLELTCQWYDSAGDTVTKKRTYESVSISQMGVDPVEAWQPVRQKRVTINAKPPGGTMPATYALATAWLDRIDTRSRNLVTATARAAWWLQPYDVVRWTNNGNTLTCIQRVTYQVDQGIMTITGFKG